MPSLRGLLERLFALRVARFAMVGVLATATDFLIFNVAILGETDPSATRLVLANTTAFACATVVGYLLNSRLTWGVGTGQRSLVRYVMVAVVGVAIYDGILLGLAHLTGAEGFLALNAIKLAAVGVSAAWNFVGFSLFAFSEPKSTLASASPDARL